MNPTNEWLKFRGQAPDRRLLHRSPRPLFRLSPGSPGYPAAGSPPAAPRPGTGRGMRQVIGRLTRLRAGPEIPTVRRA
jgi:hypothetical protein